MFGNYGSDREGYAKGLALETGLRRARGIGKVSTEEKKRMSTMDERGGEGQYGRR